MVLPKPSGAYLVGSCDIMTKVVTMPTDINCPFSLLDAKVNMGTFARLYYPCNKDLEMKNYVEVSALPREQPTLYTKGMLAPIKLTWLSGIVKFLLKKSMQHSLLDAPIASETNGVCGEKFPLVILSHGLTGFRHIYSSFCTDLASHGFLVASVEHRDGSASPTYFFDPENENPVEVPYFERGTAENSSAEDLKLRNLQVERRAEEVSRLLDLVKTINDGSTQIENCLPTSFDFSSLKGRIEVDEPLIMGHSFGGATTLNVLHKDDRFKCGFVLDPWFLPFTDNFYEEEAFKKPLFTIFTERFNWTQNVEKCQRYLDTLSDNFGEVITLKNAVHVDQSDAPGIYPSILSSISKMTGRLPCDHDFVKGVHLQRKMILDFFLKYLNQKAQPIQLLDGYELPNDFFKGMKVFGSKDEDEEQ